MKYPRLVGGGVGPILAVYLGFVAVYTVTAMLDSVGLYHQASSLSILTPGLAVRQQSPRQTDN